MIPLVFPSFSSGLSCHRHVITMEECYPPWSRNAWANRLTHTSSGSAFRSKDRPIHHYRLLAIEVFEADVEVIENAADQRMAHLKRFNTGKHSALAEKLLNEVAAARVCLLNPTKKVKYDEELRGRLGEQESGVPLAAALPVPLSPPPLAALSAEPLPVPGPVSDSFLNQFETPLSGPRRPVRVPTKKTKPKTPWAAILAVVAGLGGGRRHRRLHDAPEKRRRRVFRPVRGRRIRREQAGWSSTGGRGAGG